MDQNTSSIDKISLRAFWKYGFEILGMIVKIHFQMPITINLNFEILNSFYLFNAFSWSFHLRYTLTNVSCWYQCQRLFVWGETPHLSEIPGEWCISLSKNKSFTWEWIHPTHVKSHLNAGEMLLRWYDFSPCKQFLMGCPT